MSCQPCDYEVFTPDIVDPSNPPVDCPDELQCLLNLLKIYLGEYDNRVFTDNRLQQVLGAAQLYVVTDMACCDYVTIPSYSACGFVCFDMVSYPQYTQLLILKAVCIINRGVARGKAVSEGIKAVCGPASLDIRGSSSFLNELSNGGACQAYSELKKDLCFRCPMQSGQLCAQIVGTFVSKNLSSGCCTTSSNNNCCGD